MTIQTYSPQYFLFDFLVFRGGGRSSKSIPPDVRDNND
jgi:hypothetical protein